MIFLNYRLTTFHFFNGIFGASNACWLLLFEHAARELVRLQLEGHRPGTPELVTGAH